MLALSAHSHHHSFHMIKDIIKSMNLLISMLGSGWAVTNEVHASAMMIGRGQR